MPASVIVGIDAKDSVEYDRYKDTVTPVVAAFGAKYLARESVER